MNNPSGQPYIYAPPSRFSTFDPYNGFDPKAVTRASFVPPRPRPKPTGPLIDFNQHPDSHLVRPYGQTRYTPMSPNTKRKVETLRYIQQAFRILQLLGAIGILMCVIFIRNTSGAQGPIIRIPPIFDILISGYAIWHLLRSAKSRGPASSASYHFFAVVMDGGLIPFYIFIALVTRSNMQLASGNENRWTSIWKDAGSTNTLLVSTWVGTAVMAGMHLFTLCMSLYLCLIFRQISNLPPDMNPLEDNLTARPSKKHKHKNSELSNSNMSERKIDASVTASTASLAKSGQASPNKQTMTATSQPVSFLHTRTNSNDTVPMYSPHNPRTANASRIGLGMPGLYQQPQSARASHVDLASDITGEDDRTATLVSARSQTNLDTISSRSVSAESAGRSTPPVPRKSSKRRSSVSDNWAVHQDAETAGSAVSVASHENYNNGNQNNSTNFLSVRNVVAGLRPRSYEPVSQLPTVDDRSRALAPSKPFEYDPLGMNPPTPLYSNSGNRPLSEASGNSPATRKKYYGDLDSAMSGIRRGGSPIYQERYPYGGPNQPNWAPVDNGRRQTDGRGRVISNSGVDLADGHPLTDYMEDVSLGNGLRGRNVSGKVAEEGRGGSPAWWRI